MKFPTINRELLPLKASVFFWWGGCIAVLVYMPPHMASLGLRVQDITLIYSFLPIAHLLGPPALGMIADKLGNYKFILLGALVLCGFITTGLVFVPPSPQSSFSANLCAVAQISDSSSCQFVTPLNSTSCDVKCPNSETEITNVTLADVLALPEAVDLNDSSNVLHCPSNCTVTCHSGRQCVPSHMTVWLFFALRFLLELVSAVIFLMMESTIFIMISNHNGQYGRQRFWAIVGQGVYPLLGGYLVEYLSPGREDYSFIFYFFDGTILAIIIIIFCSNITITHSKVQLWSNLRKVLANVEVPVLFVALFFLGSLWGITKIYVLWFIGTFHGPKYLIGLTIAVGTFIALFLMHFGNWITQKMGHVPILTVGFIFYCIRYTSYFFVYNPWLFILTEAMDAVTYNLVWLAAATYGALKAPKELTATVQGIMASIHFGIGIGSGSLLGGVAINFCGIRTTFLILGGTAFLAAVLYALFYFLYVKRRRTVLTKDNNVYYTAVSKVIT